MFHKNTEKLESLIGHNSIFKGQLDTKDTVRVDGNVEGNISADWVIIGEKAQVKGDITARGIVVGGSVEGNLRARETVELRNKCRLSGEIVTAKLMICEGAVFDGRSSMQQEDESKVVELPVRERVK